MGVRPFGRSGEFNDVYGAPKYGDPDPAKFTMKLKHQNSCACGARKGYIVAVQYPDCKNFDGVKLLMYEGVYDDIKCLPEIDPHFSDKHFRYSPIARFRPTQDGYKLAIQALKAFVACANCSIWP